ncbi:MAG: endonuclease III [Deltaproteobacteria bacterium]|nr:MAG: endonuclease III [Deltaproteobacteria bacterium]
MPEKQRFSIHLFMERLTAAYAGWDAPVITLIAMSGGSPFEVLISTLLSLRTKDEVTAVASQRLFDLARTPEAMLELGEEAIRNAIYPVGFYPTKAKRIIAVCRILIDTYDGAVPNTLEALLELPGVGRKTANLVLVEGYQIPAICVDTHVHRISNRIGYVKTTTPEKTEMALRKKLPKAYWVTYNETLVAFGQVICRPISPHCSRCPVSELCPQKGVTKTR